MNEDLLSPLRAAQAQIAALTRTIPDAALDWQPDADSWSLKRILAHVAHAYDFYLLIVEQARTADFGTATLRPELPGWQRVEVTDTAMLQSPDVASLLDYLNATCDRALAVFAAIPADELDRPFVLASWRPDVAPVTTTLRRRVLETATDHLREHFVQLTDTLARWSEAHKGQGV
jgi:uncharacterized damage-inducible protein DinB